MAERQCACLESRCPTGLLGSNPSPTVFLPRATDERLNAATGFEPYQTRATNGVSEHVWFRFKSQSHRFSRETSARTAGLVLAPAVVSPDSSVRPAMDLF